MFDTPIHILRQNIARIHRRHMREWALQWRHWRHEPEIAQHMLNTAITRRQWAQEALS